MGLGTLLLYWIGEGKAIRRIAANRQAVWIGLLFVLSAGLAREYDGEDLLHEPWYALIPVAASLASSSLLFVCTYGVARLKKARVPGVLPAYRAFLGLFWMTAPLAWLYAIPYERFLSPVDSTIANLWTLGIVATWRVFLMMRVVGVLMGFRNGAIFIVMAFADAVVLQVIRFVPVPLFNIMGGIHLSPSEEVIRDVACAFWFWGILTLPIWLIGTLVVWVISRPIWRARETERRASVPLWCLGVGSVLVWIFILPITQSEQILRSQVEREFKAGRTAQALEIMSQHDRKDFPHIWDPPPYHPSWDEMHRDSGRANTQAWVQTLLPVLDLVVSNPPAPWVRAIYQKKVVDLLCDVSLEDSELMEISRIVNRWPDWPEYLQHLRLNPKETPSHLWYELDRMKKLEKQALPLKVGRSSFRFSIESTSQQFSGPARVVVGLRTRPGIADDPGPQ